MLHSLDVQSQVIIACNRALENCNVGRVLILIINHIFLSTYFVPGSVLNDLPAPFHLAFHQYFKMRTLPFRAVH